MTNTRHKGIYWDNLRDSRCPKCAGQLRDTGEGRACESSLCDFKINEPRYQELAGQIEQRTRTKIVGKRKVLPNGKIKFNSARLFRGETRIAPAQLLNF